MGIIKSRTIDIYDRGLGDCISVTSEMGMITIKTWPFGRHSEDETSEISFQISIENQEELIKFLKEDINEE